MTTLSRKIIYTLKYTLWVLSGFFSRRVSLDVPYQVTVLITYFDPLRMKHLDPQIRNLLKCNFVDKIIISNHNPDVHIQDWTKVRDARLIFINQKVRRGCGYRWVIASEFDPESLIVVDDDTLLYPFQIARLFKHLVHEPVVPHGISGFLRRQIEELEFHDKRNMEVDFLCETYAVTRDHLKRYMMLKEMVASDDNLIQMVDSAADFLLISQTGQSRPKIHDIGCLFRSESFNMNGVALHKSDTFHLKLQIVLAELNALELLHP